MQFPFSSSILFSFHFPIYPISNSYLLVPLSLYLVPFSLFHVPVPNFQIPNPKASFLASADHPVFASVKFFFPHPNKHFFQNPHTKQLHLHAHAPTYITKPPDIDYGIKLILDSLQKIICKNDSQVANLQATKMYDHSHTIWDETKSKTECTLIKVVVLNEHVVNETCDCESYKHKKKKQKSHL